MGGANLQERNAVVKDVKEAEKKIARLLRRDCEGKNEASAQRKAG